MSKKNRIIIINGPTGVGKTTIIHELLKRIPELKTGVTYTTRERRKKNREDKVMRYVNRKIFMEMARRDELLEWTEFSGHLYGTSRSESEYVLTKDPLLLNIETQGSFTIKRAFPDSLLIYILPEHISQIERRLRARNFTANELEKRLQAARLSLSLANKYDRRVVNKEGKIEEAVQEIERIIRHGCGL